MNKIGIIQKEIRELLATDTDGFKNAQLTKIKKRLQFLKTCEHYLQSDPPPKFIKAEISRLQKRLDLFNKNFAGWSPDKPVANPKSAYSKEMGLPLLIIQLRTLKFILD